MRRSLPKLVFQGKIHSALRFLSDNSGGGILPSDEIVDQTRVYTVRDALREKHPAKRSVSPEMLMSIRSRVHLNFPLFVLNA